MFCIENHPPKFSKLLKNGLLNFRLAVRSGRKDLSILGLYSIKYHTIKDSICYFIYLAMSTRPKCASQVCKLSGLTRDNAICK